MNEAGVCLECSLCLCITPLDFLFYFQYISPEPGNFVDVETGEVVGQHKGLCQWRACMHTHTRTHARTHARTHTHTHTHTLIPPHTHTHTCTFTHTLTHTLTHTHTHTHTPEHVHTCAHTVCVFSYAFWTKDV